MSSLGRVRPSFSFCRALMFIQGGTCSAGIDSWEGEAQKRGLREWVTHWSVLMEQGELGALEGRFSPGVLCVCVRVHALQREEWMRERWGPGRGERGGWREIWKHCQEALTHYSGFFWCLGWQPAGLWLSLDVDVLFNYFYSLLYLVNIVVIYIFIFFKCYLPKAFIAARAKKVILLPK